MFVARRADELRGRRVVRAAAHPLHRQARAGDHAGGDLGELTQLVGRQRPRRDDAVGGRVVDHRAVRAHRHRRETQRVDNGLHPPRRPAGGQHEPGARIHRGAHGAAGTGADLFVGVEQRAVHVAGDQRGQCHLRSPCLSLGLRLFPGAFGQLGLVERLGLGQRRRGAAHPARHPVRPCGMLVGLLHVVQQRGHRLAHRGIGLLDGLGRLQRRADHDGDRDLRAAELARMVLGPPPLRTPDDQRNDRHLRLDRHAGRAGS